ncbi:hypothetical protein PC129_g7014 [Phytophthora cactorum]|uniref:Uncharacterized protein n=1 Tax=Phytophthora cactorum TaxID=29920 RepID=A0A8T1CJD6_9STRA|nr:hypothetical protein Pcac1_g1384 [Phytophthora cactorum]KAG2925834.1 hypothetical protein PC115_g8061 [Phytophthora cactorum]KAG3222248.1 hypothetical protein PC129_g7014 [Phytophthora cactorum]
MVDLFRALPVVIVWRSFIDPVEFSGAPLRGAEFRENGYIDPPSTRGTAANIAVGHQIVANILFNEAMKTYSCV